MAGIEASVMINRPVDEVFAYMTDARTWPHWESGLLQVEQTSEGPMSVGTTFRGANQALGRRMEWTSEVTEYTLNRRWGQKIISKGWSTEESLTFEPFEGSTKFTLVSELEMGGFFKLVAPFVARMIQKQIEKDLAKLKDILEAHA